MSYPCLTADPNCYVQYSSSSSEGCSDIGYYSEKGYETAQSSLVELSAYLPHINFTELDIVSSTYTDLAGEMQLTAQFPDNHRYIRPDETIHVAVETSRDLVVLLSSNTFQSRHAHSQWLSRLNGREDFKVTHLRNVDPSQEVYRLSFTTETAFLDFSLDAKRPLHSVNGHLAVRLLKGEQTRFALTLPSNIQWATEFQIATSLVTEKAFCQPCIPALLTLYDSVESFKFTVQYPTT